MSLMNRLVALGVALVLVLGLAFWGIRMYGNSRVAAQELGSVKEAVQEAVQARAEAGKVDVQQARENSTKREAVRLVVKERQNALPKVPDCVGDAERIRLLNDAVREVNRIIAAPGVLPERL